MGESTQVPTRLSRAVVVAVAGALAAAHVVKGLGRIPGHPVEGAAAVAACLGLVALRLRPGPRPTRSAWLVAELALAGVAVGLLGVSIGLLCLPAASLLLGRRWWLLAALFTAAPAIEAVRSGSVRDTVDMTLTVALGGVMLFAVTTLALLANRVHGARLTLAANAVTDERLRIAAGLQGELAAGLTEVERLARGADPSVLGALTEVARRTLTRTRATAAELRSLSLAPEAASAEALLASAGIAAELRIGHREPLGPAGTVLATVLREAVTSVVRVGDARRCEITTAERADQVELRVVSDGVPTAALGADLLDGLAARVRAVGGRLTAGLEPDGRFAVEAAVAATPAVETVADPPELRTALGLYVFLLGAFCAKALLYLPPGLLGLGLPAVLVLCALQVRFSIQDATRYGRLALLVSAVLALTPLPWFGRNWIGAVGILAGSALIALPLRAGWTVAVGVSLAAGVVTGGGPGAVLLTAVNALITCVVVYGVLRLIRLVRELQRAAAGMARAAVLAERLRAARDLHDLLGHGLAAILLKAELATRLAGADPGRCGAELRDIAALAERGAAELGALAGDGPKLSFDTELAWATVVLEAGEITVEVEDEPLPAAAQAVLGVVLREAVTNILRHSAARHTRIATSVRGASARLEVENDGVPQGVRPPGSGIGGLSLRLAQLGGTLTAGPEDGWYLLRADLPLDRCRTPEPASELF
ncbi:histidine kinase [Kitasatospora viridis]|uniref:Signal transduction histidine kinase n=1 Tax=Kitasatospora viridis TaxID=281105 RepID=A0A561UI88_9ACTN|nr:histidine kinase [Kitasatospora viridis]TWF99067.1 signal transduction histidine kinase [Kitasatospora viridis]